MNPNSAKEYHGPSEATLINFVIALFLFAILIFLFDGFVIHNIPAPEGTFSGVSASNGYSPLSAGEPYEGAKLISVDRAHHGFLVYLLEHEGQTHLLVYEFHFITERGKLVADLIVDPTVDAKYEAKAFLCKYIIPVSGGKLGNVYSLGLSKNTSVKNSPQMVVYFTIAFLLALVESTIYGKLRKIRNGN